MQPPSASLPGRATLLSLPAPSGPSPHVLKLPHCAMSLLSPKSSASKFCACNPPQQGSFIEMVLFNEQRDLPSPQMHCLFQPTSPSMIRSPACDFFEILYYFLSTPIPATSCFGCTSVSHPKEGMVQKNGPSGGYPPPQMESRLLTSFLCSFHLHTSTTGKS